MNAEQIARKTLEPGDGHYAALTSDEIYSLCRAVLDAADHRMMREGDIVVTLNAAGEIVAVTCQDEDHHILEVIAKAPEKRPMNEPVTDEEVERACEAGAIAHDPHYPWSKFGPEERERTIIFVRAALESFAARRGMVPEIPDEIRIPLDEVRADLNYLFGRVAVDGSFMQVAADSCRMKLDKVSAALKSRVAGRVPEPPMSGSQWLPIETAPKDGSLFLVWVHAEQHGEDDNGQFHAKDMSFPDIGWWRMGTNAVTYGYVDYGAANSYNVEVPTHWAPLPDRPEPPK